jgi:UDP-N-acetylmuramate dehydrogenase
VLIADAYSEFRSVLPAADASALTMDAPLARCTSFRIGGPADLLLVPTSVPMLATALATARQIGLPVTILGGGTNVLVSDRGVRGLVVRLGRAFDYRRWEVAEDRSSAVVEAGAATRLAKLAAEAVQRSLAGIEFAAGIPGSVGGGALMNAGAFGGELGDAIDSISGCTLAGEVVDYVRSCLDFSYRKLALSDALVITSVRFRLARSSTSKLRSTVQTVQAKRRTKQPLGFPNAGSIFKNPVGEFAGRLIEQAGLKGAAVGNAQVSPDHANFIVNLGGARAQDVRDLMSLVQGAVWRRSGIWLEPEVRLIGEWDEAASVSTQVPQ